MQKMPKGIFITGTDTGVGKTYVSCLLIKALRNKKINVGAMKPIQCSGSDSDFLIRANNSKIDKKLVNPYFLKLPVAPLVAFNKEKIKFIKFKILEAFNILSQKYDFVIVEGIGGLAVPITENYFVTDLIKDLGLDLVIVSRPGLGTINHTLMSINLARNHSINVRGIVINNFKKNKLSLAEKTNPEVIKNLTKIPILGIVNNKARNLPKDFKLDLIFGNNSKKENNSLEQFDKKYIWHPFTQMQDWIKTKPLVVEEARGVYLKDTKNNWYIDGVSSLWVNVHGHRRQELDEALRNQINKFSHSTLLGLSNKPAIELAKKIVENAPSGLTKVFYSDNGSTAVEIALKIAYQYYKQAGLRKKEKFIHLNYSYHGDTLGAVSVGGIDLFHKTYKDLIFKTYSTNEIYCYRCPVNKIYPACKFKCLEKLEHILKNNYNKIAGVIVEPLVQAAGGMLVWPKGILKEIKKLTKRYNTLLICDEVATGFGRTGNMFACLKEKVVPDILCLAKGITGGYLPLAATLVSEKIYRGFLANYKDKKTFFHGHTYTGNALACSVAIANLDLFKKDKTILKLQPKIKFLKERLEKFKDLAHVGDIRQCGFMVGIELVKDKAKKKPYAYEEKIGVKVCECVRKYGLILRPLGDVIVLMPPLVIEKEELERMLEIISQAIKEVTENYYLK